jgi:arabinogalactan oligomer/maltooligosaccharide transport system permease protein
MRPVDEVGPARPGPPPRRADARVTPFRERPSGQIAKIVLLGLVGAIAVWAAFPLVESRAWVGLAILLATTAGIFYLYLGRRHVPA